MTKTTTIIKAWIKVFRHLTTKEDKRRSKICGKCEHAKHKIYLELIDDELKETKGMLCNLCQCPLSAKIRSTDICEKWSVDTN
jgi:hypothetical protein